MRQFVSELNKNCEKNCDKKNSFVMCQISLAFLIVFIASASAFGYGLFGNSGYGQGNYGSGYGSNYGSNYGYPSYGGGAGSYGGL